MTLIKAQFGIKYILNIIKISYKLSKTIKIINKK